MALSNIFREPRREITESVVGIVAAVSVAGALGFCGYHLAVWCGAEDTKDIVCGTFFGAIASGVAFAGLCGLAVLTHKIGENVCTFLDERGIELRPRDRR